MNNNERSLPQAKIDLDDGMAFVAHLPIANPMLAEQQIAQFLDTLLNNPPSTEDFFRLLEQIRVPVSFVTEESAKIYHSRPLPLNKVEDRAFSQVVEVWKKMAKAYALCAGREELTADNPHYRRLAATLYHRCIYYTGAIILEHFRARRGLPEGIWQELHGYYATAEEWGLASEPVSDTLDQVNATTHCMATYVAVLLTDCASPYSQTMRDLNLIRRWAGHWAALVQVQPLETAAVQPKFAINFSKDRGLYPFDAKRAGIQTRWFETSRLELQIAHLLEQLRLRVVPAQLGLGNESPGHVIRLLEHLQRPWRMAEAARRFRRFAALGTVKLAVGFEKMYACINELAFAQPDTGATYSRKSFDRVFTFRDRVEPEAGLQVAKVTEVSAEEWSVVNHSANGFRLTSPGDGERLLHEQLIAIKPHDGDQYLLAIVTWLLQENASHVLEAGVMTLPGVPVGVGVRQVLDGSNGGEQFQPAFALPGLPAIKEEPSLVLPKGMYQASRSLEVVTADGKYWRARMLHVLDPGADFDRVSYQAL